ncbi:SH3 domain-containing protein [Jeotgalibacillus haloalkalitolerans]|uniref:SH3 domain-containing protein n=1 Tax=Jeotgalibacillus haloalkalitolerans TaxID=3104292 RepID=A0ABU5KM62_9BACL|nr:SH3 domain-containing protein [Jeotgalibacillus sp. HH7-29]MDZ5712324.1 SH3 domain-containing protein [Jeotgalibacillus sp. HH7-29]
MKLLSVLISTVLFLSLVPELKVHAEGSTIEAAHDGILIREGPGLSYPAIATGNAGDQYKELQRDNGWVEVSVNDGSGWIAEWLLTSVNEPETEAASQSAVTTDNLRLRAEPDQNSEILSVIQAGQSVEVLSSSDNWSEVVYQGNTGWVVSEYLDASASEPQAAEGSNGTILVDRLNVRDDFSSDGNVIGTLNTGDQVIVSDEKYGWLYISTGTLTGWISSDYVEYHSSTVNQTAETPSDDIHITVNGLQVRSEPGRNADVIGTVNLYDSFSVEEQSGDWLRIEFEEGKSGWIAGWFTERGIHPESNVSAQTSGEVTILYNGSNVREAPSTDAAVVYKASAGESLSIVSQNGDWYEISLPGGGSGFIANWIVSTGNEAEPAEPESETEEENEEPVTSISEATIIIDAGHGGRDGGAVGAAGTLEKSLTIRTAEVLYHMLSSTGANVIMTREDDRYVDLYSRVAISRDHQADAFISLHYDAINDRSVKGFTTYYYGGPDEALADSVHEGLSDSMTVKNRGMQHGNFLVLRDNSAPSVLLELGFISNPSEEASINNDRFREMAATGIYNGLTEYFSE